eukprot:TRINITY_DN20259_c0_g2_i1.p1 TRINITY_DN20259_c0_g2~~TRINITY_DN20259_c0_g2_i1.p1  ORF type:complete len:1011 (-),score=192.95 TRINITY_DN20259_c0_g2_i1:70-3102(-)
MRVSRSDGALRATSAAPLDVGGGFGAIAASEPLSPPLRRRGSMQLSPPATPGVGGRLEATCRISPGGANQRTRATASCVWRVPNVAAGLSEDLAEQPRRAKPNRHAEAWPALVPASMDVTSTTASSSGNSAERRSAAKRAAPQATAAVLTGARHGRREGGEFGWQPAHEADLRAACDSGNTALHFAARAGHDAAARYLVANKLPLNRRNANGWTALVWSAINGHDRVARDLVNAGADVYVEDEEGRSAGMWAARHGHSSVIGVLLKVPGGFDLQQRDSSDMTVADHAQQWLEVRSMLSVVARLGEELLESTRRGDAKAVKAALKAGAHVDRLDEQGWTALSYAAAQGSLDLLQLLLVHGASPALLRLSAEELEVMGPRQREAADSLKLAAGANVRLLAAAEVADWASVKTALEQGACCRFADETTGLTALMYACEHGSVENVEMLLKGCADNVDQCDSGGWTAAHHAAAVRSVEKLAALHHFGADLSRATYSGDTPLHMAARADDASMVLLFVAAGVDIEAEDIDGRTPMQVAAAGACAESLNTLHRCRADLSVQDEQCRSVLSLAVMSGSQQAVAALATPPALPPFRGCSNEVLERAEADAQPARQARQKARAKAEAELKATAEAQADSAVAEACAATNAWAKSSSVQKANIATDGRQGSSAAVHQSASKLVETLSPKGVLGAARSEEGQESPKRDTPSRTKPNKKSSRAVRLAKKSDELVQEKVPKKKRGKRKCLEGCGSEVAAPLEIMSHLDDDLPWEFLDSSFGRSGLLVRACALHCRVSALRCSPLGSSVMGEMDSSGKGCIHLAAAGGHSTILQLLVRCKAPVDAPDADGDTALMLASQYGRALAVEALLESRANAAIRNAANLAPMDVAANGSVRDALRRHAALKVASHRKSASGQALENGLAQLSTLARVAHRLRLEGLPVRLPADILEGHIRTFLRDLHVGEPLRMEVLVNPITLLPLGHAIIDYGEKGADDAGTLLRSSGQIVGGRAVQIVREAIAHGRF